MKTSIFNTSLSWLLLLLMTGGFQQISWSQESKSYDKSFDIAADGWVKIENRYGKIDVNTWDKNEVSIKVVVKSDFEDAKKAKADLDRVEIEFSNTPSMVTAKTVIETKSSSQWTWFGNKSTEGRLSINYTVYMPESCSIELSNKYGDIQLAEIDGEANLTIKYGHLTSQDIGGNLYLNTSYGKATVGDAHNMDITSKYSKVIFGASANCKCSSMYSKIVIGSCIDMEVQSKYDHYEITSVDALRNNGMYDEFNISKAGSINVSGNYSDVIISKLEKSANVELKYGFFKAASLGNGVESINIDSKYTTAKLGVSSLQSYNLKLTSKYTDVYLPDDFTVQEEEGKSTTRNINGYQGSANSKTTISANMNYGKLKLF